VRYRKSSIPSSVAAEKHEHAMMHCDVQTAFQKAKAWSSDGGGGAFMSVEPLNRV
jgi:hypothetical protein